MVMLKRSWVKPGAYPVSSIVNFSFKNTQQFHDKLIDLTAIIDQSIDKAQDNLRQLHLPNQSATDDKPLSSWSDADFENFVLTNQMLGSSDDEIKRWIKQLLQRDRLNSILTTLQQLKALASHNKSNFVAKSARIKQLAKLVNIHDYYIDHQIIGHGWNRMRELSAALQAIEQQRQFPVNLTDETDSISWQSFDYKDNGTDKGARRSFNNEKYE